jgi:hypothetical protein
MMQFDFRHIIAGIFGFVFGWMLIIILFLLGSCSANYHLRKFQDKGGQCGKIDTIRVQKWDTITNTYYYHDSLVVVNDRIVPLTRTEIRYNERLRRDTIRYNTEVIKYVLKQEKAKAKNDRKTKTAPWKMIIVILGLVALILFLLRFK